MEGDETARLRAVGLPGDPKDENEDEDDGDDDSPGDDPEKVLDGEGSSLYIAAMDMGVLKAVERVAL